MICSTEDQCFIITSYGEDVPSMIAAQAVTVLCEDFNKYNNNASNTSLPCGSTVTLPANFANVGSHHWQLSKGGTSNNTGPSSGVTGTSEDTYLQCDSCENATCSVRLPPIVTPASGRVRVYFYYHMYGDDMGVLAVIADDDVTLLTLSGQQQGGRDHAWVERFVTYRGAPGADVNFTFRGTIGSSNSGSIHSDIAIDDIRVVALPSALLCFVLCFLKGCHFFF